MNYHRCEQLSVYLENRVGALAEICRIIEQKSINLIAICAIDTIEEAVLRIVQEDHAKTIAAMKNPHMHLIETDVPAIDMPNHPGATGRVAAQLVDKGINIDYIYPPDLQARRTVHTDRGAIRHQQKLWTHGRSQRQWKTDHLGKGDD